jgi:hypothetical protein
MKPSEMIKKRTGLSLVHSTPSPMEIIELVTDKDKIIKNCTVPFDKPIFQPEPAQISFQGFTPFTTYELVLCFRNIDKVGRKLRLEQSTSAFFSIQGWKNSSLSSEKIATGMDVSYIVKFTPHELIDYSLNVVCVTEREKFIVPIRAIGARACLDLPDEINFSECPVRFHVNKTILVRNIGDLDAKFKIKTTAPFKVVYSTNVVKVNESLQIDLSFNARVYLINQANWQFSL